jgi:hypothetical protein
MSNEQQTAVDLMYQRAISVLPMGAIDARRRLQETYEQAKEVEKEQILKAHISAGARLEDISIEAAEHYYNEIYGADK